MYIVISHKTVPPVVQIMVCLTIAALHRVFIGDLHIELSAAMYWNLKSIKSTSAEICTVPHEFTVYTIPIRSVWTTNSAAQLENFMIFAVKSQHVEAALELSSRPAGYL